MIEEASALFDGFGNAPRAVIRRAVFAESSDGVAWVDMGGSRFASDFGAGYVPQPGETVQILTINDRHLMFPARALPGTGIVFTVGSGLATVDTTAGRFQMPYVGTAPTSGQIVGISWSEQPYVIGALSVQPAVVVPPPDPGGGASVRSATFLATDTGSTDRGAPRWWQAQPWASNTTFGAWFYGNQIKDTIPANAQFVSLEFYIAWQQRQGSAPRFALHDAGVKGPVPGFAPFVEWAPAEGFQVPPGAEAWFHALKAGGGSAGVGLNQGGFNKFSSRAQNGMTGALRISWRS